MTEAGLAFTLRDFQAHDWSSTPCDGPELWTVPLQAPQVTAQARAVLSPDEEEAMQRFALPGLAEHYAGAHGALRLLLARWTGCAPRELRMERNAWGKPFVPGGPQFSLSHAGGLAAIAIAPEHELGVDIEKVEPFPSIPEITEQFFSGAEQAWIADGPRMEERFYRCWVLREAFVKCMGKGLSFSLESFYIQMPLRTWGYVPVLLNDKQSHQVTLREWGPGAGFAGALAVSGSPFSINEQETE